jgi:hypothetical protein
VRGLVRERTQQLGVGTSVGTEVFKTRRCRNSYGIAVRVVYDESKHKGMHVTVDHRDNRRWVMNVVESVSPTVMDIDDDVADIDQLVHQAR